MSQETLVRLPEPILTESKQRFVLFPIKYDKFWEMYKKHLASFWVAQEIDLAQDREHWKLLNPKERFFIKRILAFFASSDGIVLENLAERFLAEVQIPEARAFYGFQLAMENIHSETYSLLIDTYVDDEAEKNELFHALDTIPTISRKAEWAQKWISSNRPFEDRIVAFAVVEGIFFSGAFCSIFWLKERGKMPGLTFSNKLISRDEGLHTEFAVLMHNSLNNKCSKETMYEIVKEAVEIEKEFICESLPVSLIGMNANLMSQYIEFVADYLLKSLKVPKLFNTSNPFPFMETIAFETINNMFERQNADYKLPGVLSSSKTNVNNETGKTITFDEDF